MFKSVADIKPYYKNNFLDTLRSLYFAFSTSNPQRNDNYYRVGFVNGLASVALQVGVNPADFLSADDIDLIRRHQKGERL
jgi:hypothetical protein